MITRYGMSDEFDMVALETVQKPVFGRGCFPLPVQQTPLPKLTNEWWGL